MIPTFDIKCYFKSYNPTRFNVMSSGGGTQSVAIICLIHAGILPKPDVIVMSNTEREASNVLEYQAKYMLPLCDEMNIDYFIVSKSAYTNVDLYKSTFLLPPYFSAFNGRKKDGSCIGKQPSYCSEHWKRTVIQRFLNDRYGQSYLTQRGVDMWLGMSFDEARRIKITKGKWRKVYPLFELMITRKVAIEFVERYGLPTPPRSACWMCPNRSDQEWLWMKNHVINDFKRACLHEKEIQRKHPYLWLTRYGIPLEKINFKEEKTHSENCIYPCRTRPCSL